MLNKTKMNIKIYNVIGMSCSGCQKKITEKLNSLPHISADVDLAASKVTISSEKEINIDFLNEELKQIGHYFL